MRDSPEGFVLSKRFDLCRPSFPNLDRLRGGTVEVETEALAKAGVVR
jgi:hypothetical protein